LTALNLITGIITEKGILEAHKIVAIIKKKSKFLKPSLNNVEHWFSDYRKLKK